MNLGDLHTYFDYLIVIVLAIVLYRLMGRPLKNVV